MGCFCSKKSRRKSPDKNPALASEGSTSNNAPETNNRSGNQEEPKQYSWDKRAKVRERERGIMSLLFKLSINNWS